MIKQVYLENAGTFQMWIVSFLIVVFVFVCLISSRRVRRFLDFSTSRLLTVSVLLWLLGFILYTIGFFRDHLSFCSVVPNAIISSFKMFLISSDISRMSSTLTNDNTYMVLFTLCHFVAALVTLLWMTKLLGFRVRQYFRYAWYSRASHDRDIVNVFWGVNEASLMLADSIIRHKEESGRRNVMIFVDADETPVSETQKNVTLSNLFDVMTLSRLEQKKIEDMQAYVTVCHYDISDIRDRGKDLLKYIRQDMLKRIMTTASETRIFMLYDNEDNNVYAALNFLNDPLLAEESRLTVYSRMSSDMTCGIDRLKAIDLSYLSVAQLKMDRSCHPVNNAVTDTATATVTSDFNAMIVGYGNTGKEAFRFLYEFASFVNPQGEKVPFRCHVMDKDMDLLASSARLSMPAIKDDELKLIKAKVGSSAYWNVIENNICDMNYVIVSVGDDDLGIETAIDIYKTALKMRHNDLRRFDVYVRCRDAVNYNKMKALAEQMNSLNVSAGGRIVVFGDTECLYTYDLIIKDELLRQAKEFHKVYEEISGAAPCSADEAWERSFGKDRIRKMAEDNPTCTMMNITDDISRRKEQNFANSLHKETKYMLLGISQDNLGSYLEAADPEVKSKMWNVARCEHIRWESSHKLMGYVYSKEKSMMDKYHNCLVPWEDLDDLTRSYDYNVVVTSIGLF